MVAVLALAGWPLAARGVRAVVAAERTKEYAEAARALGMGRTRLLLVHLLPAAFGFLSAQAVLLLPAFIVAEATLSFVPKVIAAVAVLAVAGPWMMTTLVEYLQRTLQSIPGAVG